MKNEIQCDVKLTDKSRPGIDLADEAKISPVETRKSNLGVFMPEINKNDLNRLKSAIVSYFSRNNKETNNSGVLVFGMCYFQIDKVLGLAYTSSGCYAALWICNTEVYFDIERKYTYEGFTMDMGGKPIAIIKNIENEATLYITI